MSQFICPLCGKFVSVSKYDPSDFEDDILLVQVRGLGRGRGVEVVGRYSLLDGEETHVLDLIRGRISALYALLFEDFGSEEERYDEILQNINEALQEVYPEGFSDIGEASERLLEEYNELVEETSDGEVT